MSEYETRTVYERLSDYLSYPVLPESDPYTVLFHAGAEFKRLHARIAELEAIIAKAKAQEPYAFSIIGTDSDGISRRYELRDAKHATYHQQQNIEGGGWQECKVLPLYLNPLLEDEA